MIACNFYSPEEVRSVYDQIVPAYQAAFEGEPWREVSKCADILQRCAGGVSAVAIGQTCELCDSRPTRPAYERDELIERFEALADSRPVAWYTEQRESGLTLAAIAWEASAPTIAAEKYSDVPGMADWLTGTLGSEPIIWLDEVFANLELQASGNLQRFKKMNEGFIERLHNGTIAFRTINTRMVAAARRDFGSQATVYGRRTAVPDRRDFIVIEPNNRT